MSNFYLGFVFKFERADEGDDDNKGSNDEKKTSNLNIFSHSVLSQDSNGWWLLELSYGLLILNLNGVLECLSGLHREVYQSKRLKPSRTFIISQKNSGTKKTS